MTSSSIADELQHLQLRLLAAAGGDEGEDLSQLVEARDDLLRQLASSGVAIDDDLAMQLRAQQQALQRAVQQRRDAVATALRELDHARRARRAYRHVARSS
ncbi:MAG: hypothetical protein ABIJ09_17955 [Pseudomonadota bacterium]